MTRLEHLLTILSEECNETAQRATKAIRFGVQEVQPEQSFTNGNRIVYEFNDILAVMEILHEEGFIDKTIDRDAIALKKEKVLKYMSYSENLGTIIK